MIDQRFLTDQIQLLAAGDFKAIADDTGSTVDEPTNELLLELRTTLRSLAENIVAVAINEYLENEDVTSGVAGSALGVGSIDIGASQLNYIKEIFGEALDGTSGTITQDIADLNLILHKMNLASDLLNFARGNNEEADALLEGFFSDEITTITPADPAQSYSSFIDATANYPGAWKTFLRDFAGCGEEGIDSYSSTKIFATMLQAVGFAARRFLSNICDSDEIAVKQDDSGEPFEIYPNISLTDDVLSNLSVNASGASELNKYKLLDLTAAPADLPAYIAGSIGYSKFFNETETLTRLLMFLSRELSNSSAIGKYGDFIGPKPSEEFEAISQYIDNTGTGPPTDATFERNLTNLVNIDDTVPALEQTGPFSPPASIVAEPGASEPAFSPNQFATVEIDNTGFPGTISDVRNCSLFEPRTILSYSDAGEISGVRDFMLSALFDHDEVREAQLLDTNFNDNRQLNRLIRCQIPFKNSMTAYRDYISDMTGLNEITLTEAEDESTQPVAVMNRLVANENFLSLLEFMNSSDGAIGSSNPNVQDLTEVLHTTKQRCKRVHTCLFSHKNFQFKRVLAEYCYRYFLVERLDGSAKPWVEYFRLGPTTLEDEIAVAESQLQGADISDITTVAEPSSLYTSAEWGTPALLVWALKRYGDGTPDGYGSMAFDDIGDPITYEMTILWHELYESLKLAELPTSSDHPFRVLNDFVEGVLDDAHSRSKRLAGDITSTFYYSPAGTDPLEQTPPMTKSGGLDGRAIFLLCFNIFCEVFQSKYDGESGPGSETSDVTWCRTIGYGGDPGPDAVFDPGFVIQSSRFVSSFPGGPETVAFKFLVPNKFSYRLINAEEAIVAATESNVFYNIFTQARAEIETQQQKLLFGLGHLGAIWRGQKEARIAAAGATVGSSQPALIEEFYPKLDITDLATLSRHAAGVNLFSRFDEGHLTNVYKSLERKLPFGDPVSSEIPAARALLPRYSRMSSPVGSSNTGRMKALTALLNRPSYKSGNTLDASNAKIMCVGIPAGAIRKMSSPSLSLLPFITDDSPDFAVDPMNRDNSLLKVTLTKNDALLPTVTYKDQEFYYDPRLFTAHDAFDNISDNDQIFEEGLDKIKFKRAKVDIDTGEVSVVNVEFSYSTGFSGAEGGELSSLDVEAATQVATVAAVTDLLSFYLSLVSGIELNEDTFQIEERLLDQRVDETALGGETAAVSVSIQDFIGDFTSRVSLPVDASVANALLADDGPGDGFGPGIVALGDISSALEATSAGSIVQMQQILSSLFFNPKTVRDEIIFPKRFEAIACFLSDPDSFIVNSFHEDDDIASDIETSLDAAGLLAEVPDSDPIEYYVVKSGGNEDASGVIGITVSVESVDPASAPPLDSASLAAF